MDVNKEAMLMLRRIKQDICPCGGVSVVCFSSAEVQHIHAIVKEDDRNRLKKVSRVG